MVIGWLIWYLFLKAGIHPTLAGVLIAFTIPLRRKIRVPVFVNIMNKNLEEFCSDDCNDDVTLNSQQINALDSIDDLTDQVKSPLQSLEHQLHGLVTFVIMPLFAFVNAGVVFTGGLSEVFSSFSLNIALGLFIGKVIGVSLFSWLFVRVGIAKLPRQVSWIHIIGLGFLGGIGFTMSLFISNLAFPAGEILNQAKIGILIGSLFSGLLGYLILNFTLKTKSQ
jgi:NhaA family Na+:H+ antiporter